MDGASFSLHVVVGLDHELAGGFRQGRASRQMHLPGPSRMHDALGPAAQTWEPTDSIGLM